MKLILSPASGSTASGNNRAASALTENIRIYVPANTAAKAKDNARYPTGDSANNIPARSVALSTVDFTSAGELLAADDYISTLDPQFMTSDGTGAPDLPTTLVTSELECISCVTPIGNTDSTVSKNRITLSVWIKICFRTLVSLLNQPAE